MAARMNYVFCTIRDGQVQAEIPLESVSITGAFGNTGGGELRGVFHLDSTGFDNRTIKNATQPGLCFVVAERNDIPIWGGLVWARTYQSQAKVLQFYCKSYEAYPHYRFMSDTTFINTDQLNIFGSLWNTMQGEAGSNLNIVVPSSFPELQSVLQSLTVATTEYRTYGDVFDNLANGDQGFDWRIDWARSNSVYIPTLRAQQPNLGSPQSADTLTFDYPGNILNYWDTDSASDAGTNISTMGAGQGDSMLVSTVLRQDLIDSGYVRLDVNVQAKTTTDQIVLDALANQQAALHALPINTIKVQVKADRNPVFGSYALGDTVTLSLQDAWHPDLYEKATRLIQYLYTPPSSNQTEEVELIFEGLDEGNA